MRGYEALIADTFCAFMGDDGKKSGDALQRNYKPSDDCQSTSKKMHRSNAVLIAWQLVA